jgi:hypothetical protein
MKHIRKILSGLTAASTCLVLVFAPVDLEAKKNSNSNGNSSGNSASGSTEDTSGGNGNNTAPTGSNGTGQLVLGAPGVGLDYYVIQKTPFSHVSDIGRYYRYVFAGIEVQCDADGVEGSYSYDGYMWDTKQKSNNGHGNNCDGVDSSNPGEAGGGPNGVDEGPDAIDDECNVHGDHDGDGTPNHSDPDYTGGHFVFGWWNMGAKVNTTSIGDLGFTCSQLHQLSPIKRKYFNSPVVFEEQNITLEWNGTGNCNDPDGHLYILGSAVKEPPVPRGKLDIEMTHYPDGATPQYGWDINRD